MRSIVLSLFVLACMATGPLSAQRSLAQDGYFDADGVRQPLKIPPNRLAVMLRPGVSIERLQAAISAVQLRLEESFPGNIHVLVGKQSREQLIHLARKIAASNELVIAAGLPVITPARSPAILDDELVIDVSDPSRLPRNHLKVVMENPFVRGQYLLRIEGDPGVSALTVANQLRKMPGVRYAFPNFYSARENLETIPTDPLFASQWHHRNTGQGGGTSTADARTTLAWDFTRGAPGTVLAINELFGFDINHEDLQANLWTNTGEVAGDHIDEDHNGFVDDIHGWNFSACAGTMSAGCGSASLTPLLDNEDGAHATEVAGVAAAIANNGLGVAGGCPQCRFMPIVLGIAGDDFATSLAFSYAQSKGASVITNSWSGGGPFPTTMVAITTAATSGRGGLGIPVFFAAGNTGVDICSGVNMAELASLHSVIAVSSSSNLDRRVTSHGFGNCVSILAPTRWGAAEATPSGTLGITTTDRTGHTGVNDNNNDCLGSLTEPANLNYSNCFSGTSSATPLAASIAGLVFTVAPNLRAAQLRHLLQDTADKIEDSSGAYAEATGYSTPSGGTATHAFGRINAFEAVRLVAPVGQNGKGGVDVFVRDNRLDWGNTDHPSNTLLEPTRGFIPHWQSVDIKVDAPPYQPAPTNDAQFEAFVDEDAQSGSANHVYVRVRNRGPVTAGSVAIKAHWAFAGAGLPNLPADFWSAFPGDSATTTVWHPLGARSVSNLAYSGASVAGISGDAAQVVEFDFNAPPIDLSQPDPHHFCLFVVIDSPQDRAGPLTRAPSGNDFIPDALTPTDNNVTHRNIVVEGAGGSSDFSDRLWLYNPFDTEARVRLTVLGGAGRVKLYPPEAEESFALQPRERRLVNLKVAPTKEKYSEVSIVQETVSKEGVVRGGMTYRFGRQIIKSPLRGRPHWQ